MYDYYRGSSSYEDAVKRQLTVLETTNLANTRAIHEMDSNFRNAMQENTVAIQDMAVGVNCTIRENTYALVASQAMLAQEFRHSFNVVNNMLDLGFLRINSKLDAMTDRICSKLDEIHDILNNPLLTASRELYRRALDNYNRGLYEEALEDCTKAVEKNKTDFISWYLLGYIYLFGAGKFSNVIDVDKAEEAFFNAAKYIDYDLGTSSEANTFGSWIYYYLGWARFIKSNDLLIKNNSAESVKKMEEAEYASREAYRLSNKNLLALYEQAKELHFLSRDDEALQLIEKLIRTDKNYALKACNDKNFESLWDRIDNLIKTLRDELADKLGKEFTAIRALGRKGNELLANIKFPDEEQIREFEQFYYSELITKEADTSLMQIIRNDFDSLAIEVFGYSDRNRYEDVTNSDNIIKSVCSKRESWKNEFDKVESDIEREVGLLKSMLEKENDYFFVQDKYINFCGSNDNFSHFTPQRDKLISMINYTLQNFYKECGDLQNDVRIIQSYLDVQRQWDKKKAKLRDEYESEITREWSEMHNSWQSRINVLRQQLSDMDFGKKSALEIELNTIESRLKVVFGYFGNLQGDDYYSIVKKYKKLKKDNFLQDPLSYFEWSLSELKENLNV